MSGVNYLDGDTIALSHQFLRDGGTLDDLAGKLHIDDTEYLGRLLQLPAKREPVATADDEFDLWRSDELQAQL